MKTYIERHKESGIKVGDSVKVVRAAHNGESGWDNVWDANYMDEYVGSVYTITEDLGNEGFVLGDDFAFPYFVLEKVTMNPCQAHDFETPVKAKLEFDLSDPDGLRNFKIYSQAIEMHSALFDVMFNLVRNFENDLDQDEDADPVDILRSNLNYILEDIKIYE